MNPITIERLSDTCSFTAASGIHFWDMWEVGDPRVDIADFEEWLFGTQLEPDADNPEPLVREWLISIGKNPSEYGISEA